MSQNDKYFYHISNVKFDILKNRDMLSTPSAFNLSNHKLSYNKTISLFLGKPSIKMI